MVGYLGVSFLFTCLCIMMPLLLLDIEGYVPVSFLRPLGDQSSRGRRKEQILYSLQKLLPPDCEIKRQERERQWSGSSRAP